MQDNPLTLMIIPLQYFLGIPNKIKILIIGVNFIGALIQSFAMLLNFNRTYFVSHAWEPTFNILGMCYMGLFLYGTDIIQTLENFTEIFCWNIHSMGKKICDEIKRDAKWKNAIFICYLSFVILVGFIAGIFCRKFLEENYLMLKILMRYANCDSRIIMFFLLFISVISSLNICSVFIYSYYTFHLVYQIRLFEGYIKCIAETKESNQLKIKKLLILVVQRHMQLKKWGLYMRQHGQSLIALYIISGGLSSIGNSMALIFVKESRLLLSLMVILIIGFIRLFAHYGQQFENAFSDLYSTTLLSFKWYEWNVENRKMYLFIIRNMQHPVRFEIHKLVSINYENELQLWRTIYSIISVIISLARDYI